MIRSDSALDLSINEISEAEPKVYDQDIEYVNNKDDKHKHGILNNENQRVLDVKQDLMSDGLLQKVQNTDELKPLDSSRLRPIRQETKNTVVCRLSVFTQI